MKLTRRMAITFIAVPFISAVIYFTAAISLGSSIRYKVIRVYYAQLRLLADNSSLYKLNMQSQYERTGVLTLRRSLRSAPARSRGRCRGSRKSSARGSRRTASAPEPV